MRLRRVRGLGGVRARCAHTHAAGWLFPLRYRARKKCVGIMDAKTGRDGAGMLSCK